jgi:3-dehydroquinate dehydratase
VTDRRRPFFANGPSLNLLGSREPFRHHLYVPGIAEVVVAGAGVPGCELAVRHLTGGPVK